MTRGEDGRREQSSRREEKHRGIGGGFGREGRRERRERNKSTKEHEGKTNSYADSRERSF